MLDWLHRMRQTPGAIERFWRVVLVSALDEELSRTDARYGIDVFWKAFLATRRDIAWVFLRCRWRSSMKDAARPLQQPGRGSDASVRRSRNPSLKEDRFAAAVLEDGSEVAADACIVSGAARRLAGSAAEGNR